MYYWSTTFDIDKQKTEFLKTHRIKKLYIRYFDVVTDINGMPIPNATIKFNSKIPNGIDVVPVVFIVNDCMRNHTEGLANKIFKRICQMSETNDIKGIREIQIDCDWTNSTRNEFFSFMSRLQTLSHKKGIKLSATIRLHQLSEIPPPTDKGVLMMYNTGDFTKLSCHKPILDMNDVEPYLKGISKYKLPLATAYPIFGWRILFRHDKYVGIMHADDDLPVLTGDSITVREPEMKDILSAVTAVDAYRKEANDEIILFDLNNKNINRYKTNDYENIYNRMHSSSGSIK